MTRAFAILIVSCLAAAVLSLLAVPLLFAASPANADACGGSGSIGGLEVPAGVEAAARQAAGRTGVDELVLLAVTYRETRWGQARAGVPDDQALAWIGDLAAAVDRSALASGRMTAMAVGRPEGVALGDWADPIPVGSEHAIGFAQFLPSTWRRVASRARPGGGAWDPYSPLDALTLAGYYLAQLIRTAGGDVSAAVRGYGTADFPSALHELRSTWRTVCAAAYAAPGDPFGGLCHPVTIQAYGAVELFTPDGRHHGIDIACQEGATEFSVTAGVVFDVASGCPNGTHDTCGAGYGNHVVVRWHGRVPGDSEDRDYYVIYGHMLTAPLVTRGQQVQPGTPLGQQGDSGLSWGSHLHFEVDRDIWRTLNSIDPSPFLPSWISRSAQG